MTDYLLVHGAFNSGWVWDNAAPAGHMVQLSRPRELAAALRRI